MIHPDVQELVRYPNTIGLDVAMEHYNWNTSPKLKKRCARNVLKLAQLIDKRIHESDMAILA